MKFLPALFLVHGMCLAAAQTLLWSDEFDNSMSYELDEQHWDYDLGTGINQWGNGELQTYTRETANVRVENGNLVLQAHKLTAEDGNNVFTSARIKTMGKVAFKYGTLEAKIQMPDTVSGLWPAFWLMGDVNKDWPDNGEIDIAEVGWRGQDNRKVYSAAHWEHDGSYAVHDGSIDFPTDLNAAPHIYKLEWNSTFIETFVDDMSIMKLDIGPNCIDCEEFHWQHGILLNVAVGGGFTTDQATCGGSSSSSGSSSASSGSSGGCDFRGPEGITAPFPGSMTVDWIRLYDNGETEISTGASPGTESTSNPTMTVAPGEDQATTRPTPAVIVDTPIPSPNLDTPAPSMTLEPSLVLSQERTTTIPTAQVNEVIPTAPASVGDPGTLAPAPVGEAIPTATAPVGGGMDPVPAPVGEVIPTVPSGGGSSSGKGKSGKGRSKSGKGRSKSGKKSSKSTKKSSGKSSRTSSDESSYASLTNAANVGSDASAPTAFYSVLLVMAAAIIF